LLLARFRPQGGAGGVSPRSGEDAWRRLAIIEETNDGFRIAEEDLAIRGPGDFVGTRQSGLPVLSLANLARDGKLLVAAREDAAALLETDPTLSRPEHAGVVAALDTTWKGQLALAQVG
jgi:ATP-dependent DNA helicase RecG